MSSIARDDIIRMATEAGLLEHGYPVGDRVAGELERFAALVAAAEREACARICDTTPPEPFRPSIEAAHAIRARGAK